jgi:hypothetical protein
VCLNIGGLGEIGPFYSKQKNLDSPLNVMLVEEVEMLKRQIPLLNKVFLN